MKLKYEQQTIDTILQSLDKLVVQGIQNNAIIIDIYNILINQCEREQEEQQPNEVVEE